jgi:hypothetical protein
MNKNENTRAIYELKGSKTFCGLVLDIQNAIERAKAKRVELIADDVQNIVQQRDFEMLAHLYTKLQPFVTENKEYKNLRVMFKVSLMVEPPDPQTLHMFDPRLPF